MNSPIFSRWRLLGLIGLATALTLAGCGGGSSDPGPTGVEPPPVAQVGSVGIFFTDAPTDDFDEVLITVTSIEFLGDDAPVTIWQGGEPVQFDLLDLETYTDYFTFADGIPAGSYDKVRLRVSDVTLVRFDTTTDPVTEERIPVKLPANGKIDLNPRGSFEVPLGGVLLLEIDIDARRSIHVVETGSGGYRFRPVVFVDAIGSVDEGKLVRVHGVVQTIDRTESEFVLCPTSFVADVNSDADDFAEAGCIGIETAGGASFFLGTDGTQVSLDQLNEGDETTVIGFFSLAAGMDAEESDRLFVLAAEVVEIGPVGSFAMLPGTVTGPLDADNDFPFEVAGGNGFDPGYVATVETQPGTKVFSGDAEPLSILDVTQFDELTIDAVPVDGDILRSSLIIIEQQGPEEMEYVGTVASLGPGPREFQLTSADVDGGAACVVVPEGTPIQEGEDGGELADVDFDAIQADREASVFGFLPESGCISATYIRLVPESGGGT